MKLNIEDLSWEKMHGLLPAIIQDAKSGAILMLGYMNKEALIKTLETNWITFFSRAKNQLWTKGETSGNKLELINISPDCDRDALLITANPLGPTCHTGKNSCFGESMRNDWHIIQQLEMTIKERDNLRPEDSYTTTLFNAGINRIAQKVGEESVEVVIAAMEKNDAGFCGEVADLFYHLLVLLRAKNVDMTQIIKILADRQGVFAQK